MKTARVRRSLAPEMMRTAILRETFPGNQNQKPRKRRRIAFKNPAQLIDDAARLLVPEWRPLSVRLTAMSGQPEHDCIVMEFGRGPDGVRTSVRIQLVPGDIEAITSYLLEVGTNAHRTQVLFVDLPDTDEDDGDGGEELPVPTVGAQAFADLVVPATMH
jgi:hypothetical protein